MSELDKGPEVLLPEEKRMTDGFAPSRMRSFCAGRYCAHKCLESLGHPVFPVLKRESGACIWPKGYTGSISHTDTHAVAMVAKTENYLSIGLDIEKVDRLYRGLWPLLFTDGEQSFLSTQSENDGQVLASVFFSIKESFYKLWSVFTDDFIDFPDVEIVVTDGKYFVKPVNAITGFRDDDMLPAYVSVLGANVISYMLLDARTK